MGLYMDQALIAVQQKDKRVLGNDVRPLSIWNKLDKGYSLNGKTR